MLKTDNNKQIKNIVEKKLLKDQTSIITSNEN